MRSPLTVIAIGNVFHADDGFGPAVAQTLLRQPLPGWLTVHDYGVRLLHLGYDLPGMGGDILILDAQDTGVEPGTLTLSALDVDELPAARGGGHAADLGGAVRHAMGLGWVPGRLWLLGCQPASLAERMELSAPVADAVPVAADRILAGMGVDTVRRR